MAGLTHVVRHRFAVLFFAVFECILFSAVVYGWASFVFVLKAEHYFQEMCPGADFRVNSTGNGCPAREDIMNLAFTVGVFTFTAFGVVAGTLLDHAGPRITRLTACVGFGLTGILFALMDKDRSMLIFPGVVLLTMSGILLFVTMFQITMLFQRWRSLAASWLNGGLDSSSIMMLFFKLLYDAGLKLNWIFDGYFVLAVAHIGLFTFILPPKLITARDVSRIEMENEVEDEEDEEDTEYDADTDGSDGDSLVELFKLTDPALDMQLEYEKRSSFREFLNITVSPMYILLVLFLSLHKLRLWFYMGSMNMFLRFASENDSESVNYYLNAFGIIQFTGLLFSPLAGIVMDWRPKNNENKAFGFVVAFCLTNALNILLNILVLIPSLRLQLVSFVLQVTLRAFLYSTYGSFIIFRFPQEHCGKLYGLGHMIGAIVGASQFYLFVVVQSDLEGDPRWVNIGFLVMTILLFALPLYVWIKTEKETNDRFRPEQKHKPLEY